AAAPPAPGGGHRARPAGGCGPGPHPIVRSVNPAHTPRLQTDQQASCGSRKVPWGTVTEARSHVETPGPDLDAPARRRAPTVVRAAASGRAGLAEIRHGPHRAVRGLAHRPDPGREP